MNFKEKIYQLAKENMTEKGYKLWSGIDQLIPDIWDRPSSSTGKYHQRSNGKVPDIAEHTYEMLHGGIKIMRMLDIVKNTSKCDALIFSISLHDRLKYGIKGDRPHTAKDHDKLIGDLLSANFETLRKVMDEQDAYMLVESARLHSGQWSTDVKGMKDFSFTKLYPETQFVHMLDMLSANDCLKFPEE